jgi:long-chain acyl-CoA synthetase
MNKPWLKQYQEGVPWELNINDLKRYSSLVDMADKICKKHAYRIAFVNFGSSLSYLDLDNKSQHFANFLQQLGLKKKARIALMLPNVLQYPIALFGILRAGFIAVNTNPLYTVDELVYQLNDANVEAVLVLENFAHILEQALPQIKIKHVIITQIGDGLITPKRLFMNAYVKHVKKLIPKYHIPQAIRYLAALKMGARLAYTPVSLTSEDIAFLQYTGGTTGISKGAILTHGNIMANIMQINYWISPFNASHEDVIVTALPLYHIISLTANLFTFFNVGAKNILITNPKDIPRFIKTIKNSGFTAITGVDTMFDALLNNPKFQKVDFSRLKGALSGGMRLKAKVALRWKELTKKKLLEGYGLTEASPLVTLTPLNLEYNGSIGVPLPGTDISIRDNHNKKVAIGQIGELCIRGPQVMPGYWQRPEDTALPFTADGYLKTGDFAIMDEQGFLYLKDRKKDMIISSGFKIFPIEVENVIEVLEDVLAVAVVGVSNEFRGELVKACIVRKNTSLTAQDVIEHCRKHLTAYKIPKIIEFYKVLPKTILGKINKKELKQ